MTIYLDVFPSVCVILVLLGLHGMMVKKKVGGELLFFIFLRLHLPACSNNTKFFLICNQYMFPSLGAFLWCKLLCTLRLFLVLNNLPHKSQWKPSFATCVSMWFLMFCRTVLVLPQIIHCSSPVSVLATRDSILASRDPSEIEWFF